MTATIVRGGWIVSVLLFAGAVGCDDGGSRGGGPVLTVAELKDPETCKDCHPRHYEEWSTSMHAYAGEDPVFLAMNRRGQDDTDNALGDFCVKCHAPVAVADGDTTDGLNMDEVPDHKKGVTCYFCHNTESVGGKENNPLLLSQDHTMRGGISDPLDPGAHVAEYSSLHDGRRKESALMCGACHDIVTPGNEVHLERTFQEWQDSVFAAEPVGRGGNTCIGCHMTSREAPAAENDEIEVKQRKVHEHLWAGVDLALTDFPGIDVQRRAIECALATTVFASMQVTPLGEFKLYLETQAGHRFPSGAMQDRRAWVEFVAYDADDTVIYSSGVVEDDEVVDKLEGEEGYDPDLWIFRDWLYDQHGDLTHKFWDAAKTDQHPEGYETSFLPATEQFGTPHGVERTYQTPVLPARATVRVRIRPMGLEVLDELIEGGYLDAAVRDAMPTFTLASSVLEWRPEDGYGDVTFQGSTPPDCSTECLVNPELCDE